MLIHVTMYYKPYAGMSEKQKKMEGGATDARGNPLCSLEEYLSGDAEYVSLARDYLAGPPGGDKRFVKYGTRVRIAPIDVCRSKPLIFARTEGLMTLEFV